MTVPIYRGSSGLNTVVDPVRIPFNPETAITAMSVGVDVVVDETGRVSRRDGQSVIVPGNCHSLFCSKGDCLFVDGETMHRLLPDHSRQMVVEDINCRLDYAQVNRDIFYTGQTRIGIVREGGVHEAWVAQTYTGPATNRRFSGPFPSQHIAFFAGMMFLSLGNTIIHSEPYWFGLFDLARSYFSLDSTVRMMKPVSGGVFLSSDTATYFLRGNSAKDFSLEKIADYPAIEWSAAIDLVEGLDIGLQEPGLCAVWASPFGACVGTSKGQLINWNSDKVEYPSVGSRGAGLLRGENFIHTIEV